jgi:zinc transport system ATP-binding protein
MIKNTLIHLFFKTKRNEGYKYMAEALKINNLTIKYDQTIAVSELNFSVEEGEFIAIAGPNGGGKSSLIKAILNLLPVAKGSIDIFGQDYRNAKGLIGYIPQQSLFDPQFPMTVRDVVLMGRLPASMGFFHRFNREDERRMQEVMEELKIANLCHRPIGELSGGQKQKVLLARALVSDPKMLILDEPTASLDPPSRKQIYDILKELNKKMTIVMISHDDDHIFDYTTSVVYINKTLIYKGDDIRSYDKMLTIH